MNNILDHYDREDIKALSCCRLCPHKCGVNRLENRLGVCGADSGPGVSLICNHKGEEPVLSGKKGICNVFFSHCNCKCIFCQNHKISRSETQTQSNYKSFEEVADKIEQVLQTSENVVGFVSPSHRLVQVKAIIRELHRRGLSPKFVYNSGGYDNVEQIRALEGLIDVYLPDFKYYDDEFAFKMSGIKNYGDICLQAIKEMYRQKGSSLLTDTDEIAQSGLIIRHLVLPGHVLQSKKVLSAIAEEISTSVHISLMGQYYPPFTIEQDKELNRGISKEEYEQICTFFYSLGLHNGWLQELSSRESCVPDFDNNRFLNQ